MFVIQTIDADGDIKAISINNIIKAWEEFKIQGDDNTEVTLCNAATGELYASSKVNIDDEYVNAETQVKHSFMLALNEAIEYGGIDYEEEFQ